MTPKGLYSHQYMPQTPCEGTLMYTDLLVNLGTRFLCTEESPIHQNIKDKIVNAQETDTVHIFRTLRNTARVFRNEVSVEVVKIEKEGVVEGDGVVRKAKFEDVRDLVSGARGRKVYETGDVDAGVWSAGSVVGVINDCPSCEVLLRRMERGAEEIIRGLVKMIPAKL